ncbi:MAG: lytic murein transglycosylase B [Pseudomonadales bacterium]|jgi:membrane-bound lytic murein transglycosylase B|nr:lytic murein transglycosylase B [Pseudomonadales bacterium]
MFVRLIVSILVPAFVTSLAWAENASSAPEGGNYAVRSDVAEYVRTVTSEHGFKADELKALLSAVEYRADIIERISKPAEKVWTWARYKRHLVDEQRIAEGAVFWHKHADTIARAAQTFSVAPEIIVAILGIETRYGRITGTYPVLESLMTLGFDYPPRASFFRKELTEFLLLAREEDKDPTTLTGSYAGAMGYGQFISSSYRYYAVDFDDDGVRDIWANPVDAIGSIANYFHRHHWQGDHTRALQVGLERPLGLEYLDSGLEQTLTVGDYAKLGVGVGNLAEDLPAKLYEVTGDEGPEYWLALPDFYVITRYNRSHLYALAVHHLADLIKARYAAG